MSTCASFGCTVRASVIGSFLGVGVCFSNTYFGLQTGWVTLASIQSAVLGFGIWELVRKCSPRATPLSVRENVVLQTIAVAAATMPLSAGFVGIIPALRILSLSPSAAGGGAEAVTLSRWWEQIVWSLAICFFGVFIAVPLRKQMIRLSFPTGTATAAAIAGLHGVRMREAGAASGGRAGAGEAVAPTPAATGPPAATLSERTSLLRVPPSAEDDGDAAAAALPASPPRRVEGAAGQEAKAQAGQQSLGEGEEEEGSVLIVPSTSPVARKALPTPSSLSAEAHEEPTGGSNEAGTVPSADDVMALLRVFAISTAVSATLSLIAFFVPVLANLPLATWFGLPIVTTWGWTLSCSLSYVGQGIIMGPRTALSMLAGAAAAFILIGPYVQAQGWTSGNPLGGSASAKGFLVWVSLGILLADAGVGVAVSAAAPCMALVRSAWGLLVTGRRPRDGREVQGGLRDGETAGAAATAESGSGGENTSTSPTAKGTPLEVTTRGEELAPLAKRSIEDDDGEEGDPLEEVPRWWWVSGLVASAVFAVAALVPVAKLSVLEVLSAILLSLPVAYVAIRALGETDLNPVSSVSKVSQFAFAAIAPGNLVACVLAGGVAEAGAAQAGDLMSDLKTGHLLGVPPRVQFYSQLLGSFVSVFAAVAAFALYDSAFGVPSTTLPAPTASVWVSMAQLVNGGSLPVGAAMITGWAAGITFLICAVKALRERCKSAAPRRQGVAAPSNAFFCALDTFLYACPSPTAFAIGAYVTPNFTLLRALGALAGLLWQRYAPSSYAMSAIMLATGFVLGEGLLSLLTALLTTLHVAPATCAGCAVGMCGNACPS